MEIWVHLVEGFPEAVERGNSLAADPFVSRPNLCAKPRNLTRNANAQRMPDCRLQDIAKRVARVAGSRSESTAEGINSGQLRSTFERSSQGHTRAPIAGCGRIIGKAVGEIILEVIGGRQKATAAVDGHIVVVLMKGGDLKDSVSAELAVGRKLFMQAALQHRMAIAEQECGESVQFVKGGGQRSTGLPIGSFKRSGAG